MQKLLPILFTCLLFNLSPLVLAAEQSIHSTEEIKTNLDDDDSYWELDLGLVVEFNKHYIQGINEDKQGDLSGLLLLSGGYYYKDFFLEVSPLIDRPLTIGYSLQRTKHFVVNVIAESLFDGFDQASQRHGSQLTGINTRRTSLDAGVEVYYSYQYGETRFRVLKDISNTHNGYVIAFDYAYPIFKKRWTIWPSYGITWLSSNTTDYYFGIDADEVTATRPQYQPESAFTHKLNLYIAYQYNTHLSFIGYGDYILFSQNINNSPLVAPNNDSFRVGMGVMWSF
ncbi:MAG: MipA/OmpV family protein [Alteromonadaceae bacterium]|nr:MipA/OmpV family protein [Alteromonadaceae bacterium]